MASVGQDRGLLARPPAVQQLAVALGVGARGEQLHAVAAGLELADGGGRDAEDVAAAEFEDLVLELDPARAGDHDVQLLDRLVAVAEARAPARGHAVPRQADALGAHVVAHVARLAALPHAELRREVVDVLDVDPSVSGAHRRHARGARRARLGRIRQAMTRPTASTRGILGPDAIGRVFSLRRTPPAPDLAHLVERHWVVEWDLGDPRPSGQEVVTPRCDNLAFEPHGGGVFGVEPRSASRLLRGRGWAVGLKFRPGGFSGFFGRPVHELTDRALPLAAVFGEDGARLADEAAATPGAAAKTALAEAFLRARMPPPAPDGELGIGRAT